MKIGQKLFAILLAISMALSISACGEKKNNGDSSTAEGTTTKSETTAEMKTIEPPADGWTPELLNQVMYLNGKPFSLPCSLEDLGEGYSFSKDVSDWNDGTGGCELLYNKEIVASVLINNYSDSKGVSDDSKIIRIMITKQITDKIKKGFDIQKCSVNGVFLGSTREEVLKRFGSNYNDEWSGEEGFLYNYKNTDKSLITVSFLDNENKKIVDLIIINSETCN